MPPPGEHHASRISRRSTSVHPRIPGEIMAFFFGSVDGQRRTVSTVGNKSSGLKVIAASYQGAVRTELVYNDSTGNTHAKVELVEWDRDGSPGKVRQVLFDGVLNTPE